MADRAAWEGASILGIDLGTTYSAVTIWHEGQVVPIEVGDGDGELLLPSVVAWDAEHDAWLVGRAAEALGALRPGSAAYSVKRFIGRWFSDPQVRIGQRDLGYTLVSGGGVDQLADGLVELAGGAPRVTAPEVSGRVLQALHAAAARALGQDRKALEF